MNFSSLFPTPGPDSLQLRKLAALISDPNNYYEGVGGSKSLLPENILCFVRHRNSDLLHPSSKWRTQHHRCVLLIALQGSGRVCVESENFMIREGEAQLIFPFQFHSYLEVQPEEICWLFVTFELFSLAEIACLRSSPSHPLGSTELVLVRELLQCWLEKDRQELLSLHLGLLIRRLSAMGASPKSISAQPVGADANLLARVNGYVRARLDRAFGLKELAAAIGQSESHLRARFRAATGCSIGRHIRNLRLQQACNLLHTSGLSISEVAENCGFDSLYAFSRAFKVEHGISPKEYRRGIYSAKEL